MTLRSRRLWTSAAAIVALACCGAPASAGWHSSGGSWGSSGGSSGGSWGSSGGSSGGYYYSYHHGSSGGSHGSSGGSSGGGYEVYDYSTPEADGNAPAMESVDPNAPAPAEDAVMSIEESLDVDADVVRNLRSEDALTSTAILTVRVPADAVVLVNGYKTNSVGVRRQFVSRGLEPGVSYNYEIVARIERNGEPVEETRTIRVEGGDAARLAFRLSDGNAIAQARPEPTTTRLVVRLPEDASLELEGVATKAEGDVREFTTTRLAEGQAWADYTVRATVIRDGQTLVSEKTIRLAAGDDREVVLAFHDDVLTLASAE